MQSEAFIVTCVFDYWLMEIFAQMQKQKRNINSVDDICVF
jgi:hypothetical protein